MIIEATVKLRSLKKGRRLNMDKYLTENGEINLNAVANDFIPHQSVRRIRAADVKTGKDLWES